MSGKNLALRNGTSLEHRFQKNEQLSRFAALAGLCAALLAAMALTACGGGSSGGGGGNTVTPPPTPVANSVSISVDSGPNNVSFNTAYVSVTICNPGTSTCATVPDVELDTGSTGLRILASAPGVSTLALKPVTNSSSTPVDECIEFSDGTYVWGPVMQADVEMAGEKASGLPIQIIDSGSSPSNVPNACSNGGVNRGTSSASVDGLNANGILGVSPAPQDCGANCTSSASEVLPYYYLCPTGLACTSNAALSTSIQVSNPAIFFSGDNNGVMITMSSVGAAGTTSVTGTLNWGIGTQSDNALGSAKVYALGIWPSGAFAGQYVIEATYNSNNYPAFLDTGSSAIFFLDPTTTMVAECTTTDTGYYCPESNTNFNITNTGYEGTATQTSITIGNAQSLLSNTGLAAYSDLVALSPNAPSGDAVDYGMPFFYGKTIFVGIAGATAPTGVSAAGAGYWAF